MEERKAAASRSGGEELSPGVLAGSFGHSGVYSKAEGYSEERRW